MAEKQLAYRASGKDDFFADDDPLAELARIVGFDTRPAAPVAANQRQEPVFDLEDELLREFERYDAPRAAPAEAPSSHAPVASSPFVDEGPAPSHESAVSYESTPSYEPTSSYENAPQQSVEAAPVPETVEQYSWQQEQSHAAPVYEDNAASWNPAEESWELPAEEPAPYAEQAFAPEVPAIEARDLAEELELSIGGAPAVSPAAKTPQWAAASIRLPLANFNAPRREPTPPVVEPHIEPVFDIVPPAPLEDFEAPSLLGFPTEQDRHEFPIAEAPVEEVSVAPEPIAPELEFDLVAAARDGTIEPDAALTQPAYAPVPAFAGMDIDDLLADVSRYPVPSREVAARIEPSVSVPAASAPVQVAAPAPYVDDLVAVPPAAPYVGAEQAVAEIDPFDDSEFDLDLAEIELELAQLDLADANAASPHAPTSPSVEAPSEDDWFHTAPAPVVAPQPVAVVSPRAAEPAFVKDEAFVEAEQELPFDPSEISDTEDRIETFEDMHVPALPPVEEEEPIAAAPDYDFDIDAEMANLFSAPAAEVPAEPVRAAPIGEAALAQVAVASARGNAFQKPVDGLDEFERALEEDFRRSFRETTAPVDSASQMMFESSSVANDRWRARSMRGFAIAAAAVVIVGAGAYGVYGWISHGASSIGFTSGEPRVIVADKDPVKVVPDNPGGKIVPNQDKAVYDRVAGDSAQAPKQKELVTSDEQPVDVVQKTLIPEAVSPDDSDGNPDAIATPTPVGETEDPRLLPNQGNTATAAAQDQNGVPSVAPRRVRTMIVKPDGTLVPREEDAPAAGDAPKAATPALASPTKPAPATQVASATPAPAANDAASAESAPIRVVKTTNLANAPAAAAADATPVPTTRPAQPTPVASTPVKPAVAAKPPVAPKPAPTQVAVATPAPQPVKATPEPAASAGGYVVQIASLPSEDEAKRSQANLTSKFAGVLGGHAVEVRKFDVAGKGTYYRVRVVAGSKDDAAALCVKYRAAGGTCLISK